jgi:hypothetical protein
MKVLDLRCANGHVFEGWFASEDDFMGQNGRGLVECPLCADKTVGRLPSAPRLNLSGARDKAVEPSIPAPSAPGLPAQLQAAWLQAMRQLVASTEDVGERFSDEARRIHYGEVEARGIRGLASPEQREALLEEGIAVAPLPLSRLLKEPLQ